MRLGTVIRPTHRWSEGQQMWRRAEEPWFGSTLTATATERVRLGTLATSVKPRSPIAA
ncbi:hypothetical protein ACFVT9_33020 [Kitasatospora cineracea]|uniref:hypothetical protein n=1 Tax=Kitasatospora cineracea TaxID=88074 RepID=UPI0036C7AA76